MGLGLQWNWMAAGVMQLSDRPVVSHCVPHRKHWGDGKGLHHGTLLAEVVVAWLAHAKSATEIFKVLIAGLPAFLRAFKLYKNQHW